VRLAVQALIVTHGEMSIADVAVGTGLSLRQLERRFIAAVGLNPVQYAKLRKMRGDALPLLGSLPLSWGGIAESLGGARP
jgi:transcriptional regulator GlxA family with amidase domain